MVRDEDVCDVIALQIEAKTCECFQTLCLCFCYSLKLFQSLSYIYREVFLYEIVNSFRTLVSLVARLITFLTPPQNENVSWQLVSWTSLPSEERPLQTCYLMMLHARCVFTARVCRVTSSPALPLFGSGCRDDLESVPTASHFHKQMSGNIMTPSSPHPSLWTLPVSCTPPSRLSFYLNITRFLFFVVVQIFYTHCLHVIHTGDGCGEWPGDSSDDRHRGECHGQLCPEPGGVPESANLHTDSGILSIQESQSRPVLFQA